MYKKMIVAVTLILAFVYALCGCKLSMSEYKAESSEISASADTTASVDTSALSGQSDSASASTSVDNPPFEMNVVEQLFGKYYYENEQANYDPTGHFYKTRMKSLLSFEKSEEETDTFIVTVSGDVPKDCDISFKTVPDEGVFVTDNGEKGVISASAGESFKWKASRALVSRAPYTHLYIEMTIKYQGHYVCYGAAQFVYERDNGGYLGHNRTLTYALPEVDGKFQQIEERRMQLVLRSEHTNQSLKDMEWGREYFDLVYPSLPIYLDIPVTQDNIALSIDGSFLTIIFNVEYKDKLPDFDTAIAFTGAEEKTGVSFICYSNIKWLTQGDYSFGFIQTGFSNYRGVIDGYEKFYATINYLRTLDCIDYVGMIPPATGDV